jgi:hypothetical protein
MAVTAAPTELASTIAAYRLANPSVPLTHIGVISTAPGSLATPSNLVGGFFMLAYDPVNNVLITDYTSTQSA